MPDDEGYVDGKFYIENREIKLQMILDEQIDKQTNRLKMTERKTVRQTDGQRDGWTDGRMYG